MDYSVTVEARAPSGEPPLTYADDLYDDPTTTDLSNRLMDCIEVHHGSGGVGARTWSATISVEAEEPGEAGTRASTILVDCARGIGLPVWPIVHLEIIESDLIETT